MRIALTVLPLLLAACAADRGDEAPAPAASDSLAQPSPAASDSLAEPPAATDPASPAPLDSADFALAGLRADADSAAVRRALGAPDSVVLHDNPFDPGSTLPSWYYRELTVAFGDPAQASGYVLTGPGVATRRGARVGDPPERIRALYGAPFGTEGDDWDYADPADASGLHVIRFTFTGGRVSRIFLGWLLD